MRFKAVKGTRDFYPDRMALRNYLTDTWRKVSARNGFVEFDGPVLEYLDLFSVKSGDEIVSQLFSFTDRGGRALAMRPEITPTLARMVNAQINSLPRPIKWFSVPRLFRAENPQKGRLREFFQWNVDVIGSDDVLADAECIFTAVDCLGEMELSPQDVVVRIGSRPLTVAALRQGGVDDSAMETALAALDKRPKVPPEAFAELAAAAGIPAEALGKICDFQDAKDLSAVADALGGGGAEVADEIGKLESLMEYLAGMGAGDYCRLDMRIVRGLAYYTGIVYEIFDAANSLRAVAGGGRYDNLLQLFGGPAVGATGFGMGDAVLEILLTEKGKLPDLSAGLDCFVIDGGGRYDNLLQLFGGPAVGATGFGMGDAVLEILLNEKGKLPDLSAGLDCFVIDGGGGLPKKVLELVGRLRRGGIATDFSAKRQAVGKQLKEANRRNARYAVIVRDDEVGVKNLTTGEQTDVPIEDFLENPVAYMT